LTVLWSCYYCWYYCHDTRQQQGIFFECTKLRLEECTSWCTMVMLSVLSSRCMVMLSVLSWDEWDYCGEYTTRSLSKRQYKENWMRKEVVTTHFQIQYDLNQCKNCSTLYVRVQVPYYS
jgi:hypothetical protein